MEIERKFLIDKDKMPKNIENYEHKHIIQDYLYVDYISSIRKRCISDKTNTIIYTYTIKTNKIGCSVEELETQISEKQYNKLNLNPNYNTLDKIRYIIPYKENLIIELDVFKGLYDGIIFAEIEFENEQQMLKTPIPSWFGKELSTSVTNSMMASMDVNEIKKIINEI